MRRERGTLFRLTSHVSPLTLPSGPRKQTVPNCQGGLGVEVVVHQAEKCEEREVGRERRWEARQVQIGEGELKDEQRLGPVEQLRLAPDVGSLLLGSRDHRGHRGRGPTPFDHQHRQAGGAPDPLVVIERYLGRLGPRGVRI